MPQAAMLDIADFGGTMTLKGPLQTSNKDEKQFVWVVAFNHQAACEWDPKTGLPKVDGLVGKKPVVTQSEFVITKKIDYTTPLFHAAYKNGRELTPWELHLWQIPASGGANNYFDIVLTGAKIKSIRLIKPPMFTPNVGQAHEVEQIAFTYTKIRFSALAVNRGLDYGAAPPDAHSYTLPIEPNWEEQQAKAAVEKMYGLVSDKLKNEIKAKLVADGVLTAEGLPGEHFSK